MCASYSYDNADRLLTLANITSGGTTLSSFYYALDSVGNRSRVVEADGTRVTWSYDNTYQLKRETRGGAHAYDVTYSYDPAGNRKTMLTGGVTTTYTCDAANQLTSYQDNTGTTSQSFDANGNQRVTTTPAGSRTTYSWDFENRPTQWRCPSECQTHSCTMPMASGCRSRIHRGRSTRFGMGRGSWRRPTAAASPKGSMPRGRRIRECGIAAPWCGQPVFPV